MDDLGLADWIVEVCGTCRITTPTTIQKECIPVVLAGGDVLGVSPTGSGKTACYLLPILQKYVEEPQMNIGLILVPTRELAIQVEEQACLFGERAAIRTCVVTGGADLTRQKTKIMGGSHIIVGTPGRTKEILSSDAEIERKLRRLKFAVLDEVDRLLQSPMDEEVGAIMELVPASSQILFFSATLGDREETKIRKLRDHRLNKHLKTVNLVKLGFKVDSLQHKMIICPEIAKMHYLIHLLKEVPPFTERGIIFVRSILDCEQLKETLLNLKIDHVVAINSLQIPSLRKKSLSDFRKEQARILVATDLASRGLDLPLVDFVINFDLPKLYQDYCHRVGRCARAQRPGLALSLVCPVLIKKDIDKDIVQMESIQNALGHKVEELKISKSATRKEIYKIARAQANARVRLSETTLQEKYQRRQQRRRRQEKNVCAHGDTTLTADF